QRHWPPHCESSRYVKLWPHRQELLATLRRDNFLVTFLRRWCPSRQEVARRKPAMFPLTEPRSHDSQTIGPHPLSPMTLSDRLITLAKDADTLGYAVTAEQL